MKRYPFCTSISVSAILFAAAMAHAAPFGAVLYPGARPGPASGEMSEAGAVLKNNLLEAVYQWEDADFSFRFTGSAPDTNVVSGVAPLILTLADGRTFGGADFVVRDGAEMVQLAARPEAHRLAERFPGRQLRVPLRSRDESIAVLFTATLRDESNYVIQQASVTPLREDVIIDTITLLDLTAGDARVVGDTQGAPVTAGALFFAFEHPMAENRTEDGRVVCAMQRGSSLKAGTTLTQSCVLGVTPPEQMRRGFLYYVERERAHPYRPFLHYNSWYDIAWVDRKFNEAQALEAIRRFGEELIVKRGVTMQGFVFDDGWDDNATLWQFHEGFPNGFAALKAHAEGYGSALGTWLSPFGGYDEARRQRLEFGAAQGFEINRNGFSLAGERYYGRFRAICTEMIEKYGVNFFKFDGMGPGNNAVGGGEFLDDIEALMRLTGELRALDNSLYISATTGTWCSPYFLWHADNTWRSSQDMNFCGKGSKRQQWINYRDTHTYRNVVRQGPLYPLNSLMTQGIVHGRHGPAAMMSEDPKDFADEVWSFFGSGTSLQELYIAPQLLTEDMWDILASGARWAQNNADVLVDTHWIGGDPGEHQPYGWASWNPRKGILVLRNPDDKPARMRLDIGEAFELPPQAAQKFRLVSPGPDPEQHAPVEVTAGTAGVFQLEAFQTIVYDAEPIP